MKERGVVGALCDNIHVLVFVYLDSFVALVIRPASYWCFFRRNIEYPPVNFQNIHFHPKFHNFCLVAQSSNSSCAKSSPTALLHSIYRASLWGERHATLVCFGHKTLLLFCFLSSSTSPEESSTVFLYSVQQCLLQSLLSTSSSRHLSSPSLLPDSTNILIFRFLLTSSSTKESGDFVEDLVETNNDCEGGGNVSVLLRFLTWEPCHCSLSWKAAK